MWQCQHLSAPPESSADCDCGGGGFGGDGDGEYDGSHDDGGWGHLTGPVYHGNVNGICFCTLWVHIHCRLPEDEHELSWPLLLPRLLAAENQSGRALVSLLVNSLQVLGINTKDNGTKSEDFINVLEYTSNITTDNWCQQMILKHGNSLTPADLNKKVFVDKRDQQILMNFRNWMISQIEWTQTLTFNSCFLILL